MMNGFITSYTAHLIFEQMPIQPDVPNNNDSPWYQIMQDKGEFWNEYSQELNVEIHGKYNAYRLSFVLNGMIKKIHFMYEGRRQLRSASTKFWPVNGKIIEELNLQTIGEVIHHLDWFEIRRKSYLNLIRFKLFNGYEYKEELGDFYILYNAGHSYRRINKYKIVELQNLQMVKYYRKGLSLKMGHLITEEEVLKRITNFCFSLSY